MYPAMIEAAKAEDNKEALRSFDYANAVEEFHHKLYEGAMAELGSAGEVFLLCLPLVRLYGRERTSGKLSGLWRQG